MIKYVIVYTIEGDGKRVIKLDAYSLPDAYKRFEEIMDGVNWVLLAISVDSVIVEQHGHMSIVLK